MPNATLRKQDTVALNVNMILGNTSLKKKDLAKALGISPQSLSSRLNSSAIWSIDEVCRAADFFGIPLLSLLDPQLTPASALAQIAEHDNEGGLPVVSNDDSRRPAGHGWPVANLTLAA